MHTDQWQLLKKLFQETLEKKPEERTAFLDEACKGNPDLRSEIEALLTADDKSDQFMESPPVIEADGQEEADTLINTRIGRYLIEEVISSGGMGTVYRAVQDAPRRSVAVKVMREGMTSRSALRRFEYEAEILGRLTHTNIAQVIEAGTHAPEGVDSRKGTPYFVLEYVPDARPITEHAWQRKLTVAERLTLFTQICEAVHFGHQKGIIHRDLKPSNILVNRAGQVKVIDFGIARVTDSDFQLTSAKTDVGQLMGTVQYMSPEQCEANADDLDVRSDVYALGVVLYELLCEKLPYDVRKALIFEATRIIRETEPGKPSTTNIALRGDVETILLKALEKDRTRRYQTVADFAADIRRHLSGEVILARPAGPWIRTTKWVRRHPVRTTLLLSLIAILCYILLYSVPQIREERDAAKREMERAVAAERRAIEAQEEAERQRLAALEAKAISEQEGENTRIINQFLEEMFILADPFKVGRDIKMHEMLDKAVARIDEEFPDRPEIEASLRTTIGYTFIDLGDYAAAEVQLRKALDIRKQLFGDEHEDTLSTKNWLGLALIDQGKHPEAEPILKESIEACRRLLGDDHAVTIHALNSYATLLVDQARRPEAIQLLRESSASARATLGVEHDITLSALYILANALHLEGNLPEAESILKEVLEIRTRLVGENHPDTLNSMNSLGNVLISMSKFDEGEKAYMKSLETYRSVLGEEHPFTLGVMNNLANAYLFQGQYDESESYHRQIFEIRSRVLGEEHPETLKSMNNVAVLLDRQERDDEAEAMHRRLLEIRIRVLGEDHSSTLHTMENVSMALADRDEFDEALAIQSKVLETRLKKFGENNPEAVRSMRYLADVLKWKEQYEEAEKHYLKGYEISCRIFTSPHATLGSYQSKYGDLLRLMKQFEKAEEWLMNGYNEYANCVGESHRWTRAVVRKLISLYEDWQKPEELEKWQEVLDKGKRTSVTE